MDTDLDRKGLTVELVKALGKNLRIYTEKEEDSTAQMICISFRDAAPTPQDVSALIDVLWQKYGKGGVLILCEDEIFADDTDYLIRQHFNPDDCRRLKVVTPGQGPVDFDYDILLLPKKLRSGDTLEAVGDTQGKFAVLLEPNIEFAYSESPVKKINLTADGGALFKLLDVFNELVRSGAVTPQAFDAAVRGNHSKNVNEGMIKAVREDLKACPDQLELLEEVTAQVKEDPDAAFLMENPIILDIFGFCCSLMPDSPTAKSAQDGKKLYQRIKRQKKKQKEAEATFVLYEEEFDSMTEKVARTEPEKKELRTLLGTLMEDGQMAELAGLDKDAFKEELTRKLIDIVMASPQDYRNFGKFGRLYNDFMDAAFENRKLLKERR